MRAGEIRDGSEAVFVGARCAACCVAFACDDGRDPSGMWPYPLWVWPNLACRDDVGCASPCMWPCPRWAWPNLVRRDAFDAYGTVALLRGLALARKEVVDVTGAVSEVDAALCESAYKDALFGAAAPVALDGEMQRLISSKYMLTRNLVLASFSPICRVRGRHSLWSSTRWTNDRTRGNRVMMLWVTTPEASIFCRPHPLLPT